MIVFLYGKDSYRRDLRRRYYESQFEKKYGSKSELLDLEEDGGAERLGLAAREQGLFSSKRLFSIRNAFELEPKKLLLLLEPFKESKELHLLISEDKKPVKALGFLLAKPVTAEELDELEGAAWTKFIKREVEKRGTTLDAGATTALAEIYAGNSWALATELEKLAHFPGTVTKEVVFSLGIEAEGDTFPLIQSLRGPRPASRLGSLAALEAKHEPAAKVFNILAALRPQEASMFAKYDEAIKFGRMDYEEALTDIVLV